MKNKTVHSIIISLISLLFHFNGYAQTFLEHNIEQNFPGICIIKVFDLDLDGDYDIIGGSEHTPYGTSVGIAWWRNEGGYPIQWTKFQISSTFLHVMSVDAGLIDNDTLPDIITSSWENGKISWWKNSGNPTQNWTENILASGLLNAHDAVISDLNNDGINEIIGVSAGNNRISIFYNQSDSIPLWNEDILTNTFFSAKSVSIVDINNDSELDIIGSADGADDIIWWDNNGGNWNKNYVTSNLIGAAKTNIIDINQDGQLDIIGAGWEGNEISYWISDDISTNSWTKTVVTDNLEMACSAIGSDIDADGDIDIIAVGKIPGKLVIYYNNNSIFTESILNSNFNGGAALAVIDIDNDGDDDIISGAGIAGDLFLYENTLNTKVSENNMMGNDYKVYPNPSRDFVNIESSLFQESFSTVKIFDNTGREIKTLFDSKKPTNTNKIIWNMTNNAGQLVKSGMYYCQIQAGHLKQTVKIITLN